MSAEKAGHVEISIWPASLTVAFVRLEIDRARLDPALDRMVVPQPLFAHENINAALLEVDLAWLEGLLLVIRLRGAGRSLPGSRPANGNRAADDNQQHEDRLPFRSSHTDHRVPSLRHWSSSNLCEMVNKSGCTGNRRLASHLPSCRVANVLGTTVGPLSPMSARNSVAIVKITRISTQTTPRPCQNQAQTVTPHEYSWVVIGP